MSGSTNKASATDTFIDSFQTPLVKGLLISLILLVSLTFSIFDTGAHACTPEQFFALMADLEKQQTDASSRQIEIFVEDSLLPSINAVADKFKAINPGYRITLEPSSAKMAVRKIMDMGRVPDILLTRGIYLLQTENLVPDYSPFFIQFARDRIVLAYTSASAGGADVNADNWDTLLAQGKAVFGRVARDSDPLGVYTDFMAAIMTSSSLWKNPSAAKAWNSAFPPATQRIDALDLVRQLETGNLDYAFIYASLAQSHRLKSLEIPEPANLGTESMAWETSRDGSVDLKVSGRRFRVPASPAYAVACVMNESTHPGASTAFIRFLVQDGQPFLRAGNLTPYTIEGLLQESRPSERNQKEQEKSKAESTEKSNEEKTATEAPEKPAATGSVKDLPASLGN